MKLATNSRLKCYRECARQHHLKYNQGWQPVNPATALTFGSAFHLGMEHYWRHEPMPERYLDDPFEDAKCRAMMAGYEARWEDEDSAKETVAVELPFEIDLIHPITGEVNVHWRQAGKVDLLFSVAGRVSLCDHKTSAQDISLGSTYWQALRLDTQILTYMHAVRQLGYEVEDFVYDVVKKPTIRPKKNEPPEEYGQRCLEQIAEDPNGFYNRGVLVRTQDDIDRALIDLWDYAERMHRDAEEGYAPRNPEACFKWGRACMFLDHCAEGTPLETMTNLKRVENVNPELTNTKEEV